MIGAIIGDIVGSRFEFHNHRSKKFSLFDEHCFFTDDTVMTIAVSSAVAGYTLCHSEGEEFLRERTIARMQNFGQMYDGRGYGGMFLSWIYSKNPQPYYSFGNGAAMRVSACAYAGKTLSQALKEARIVTGVTHNHPEGIKGAEATTAAIWLALEGASKKEIIRHINSNYYTLNFTLREIRRNYLFDESCQGTVPQAIEAFAEATSFEDAIRNAISIGGDSDTLAAITGSIAAAYYGVPIALRKTALSYLPIQLRATLLMAEPVIGCGKDGKRVRLDGNKKE